MRETARSITFQFIAARGRPWKPASTRRCAVSKDSRPGRKALSALVYGCFWQHITCHKSQFKNIRPLYAHKAAKNGEILSYTH
jgi:hypothetical protein